MFSSLLSYCRSVMKRLVQPEGVSVDENDVDAVGRVAVVRKEMCCQCLEKMGKAGRSREISKKASFVYYNYCFTPAALFFPRLLNFTL